MRSDPRRPLATLLTAGVIGCPILLRDGADDDGLVDGDHEAAAEIVAVVDEGLDGVDERDRPVGLQRSRSSMKTVGTFPGQAPETIPWNRRRREATGSSSIASKESAGSLSASPNSALLVS